MSFKRKARRATRDSVREHFPPSYFDDAQELQHAAAEYFRAHPGEVLCFELPPELLDPVVMPLGNLDKLERYAKDEASAAFVRWLDERTEHKCTLFQFRAVVEPMLRRIRLEGAAKA